MKLNMICAKVYKKNLKFGRLIFLKIFKNLTFF